MYAVPRTHETLWYSEYLVQYAAELTLRYSASPDRLFFCCVLYNYSSRILINFAYLVLRTWYSSNRRYLVPGTRFTHQVAYRYANLVLVVPGTGVPGTWYKVLQYQVRVTRYSEYLVL